MAVFVDLNLRKGSDTKALKGLVENAAHLGYSTVAINHVVDFKGKKQEIDKPIVPSELFSFLPIVQGKSKPIKILSRLTLIVSDPSQCNVLRATSSPVKLYDIVAVFPKTEKLFHVACTGFDLTYSSAIKDSTMRRYTISNALSLMQICKGKNVIVSSGAERPLERRGLYDIANLGLLFGLSESDAKAAVSTNCRAILLHGETRKTAFGIIYTTKKPRTTEEDDNVPACKKAKCED
uniref:Uncharacterized protein n=1 Tax=Monodelphis domestica TaxID=13616 RepID=F7GAN6_MONDO